MNDFLTVINFSSSDENKIQGNIKMFAGNNLIQDDALSDINLTNYNLTFKIPAKETLFEGSFNNFRTELSGNFIFPDGSNMRLS